jgi:hypothetical protein
LERLGNADDETPRSRTRRGALSDWTILFPQRRPDKPPPGNFVFSRKSTPRLLTPPTRRSNLPTTIRSTTGAWPEG